MKTKVETIGKFVPIIYPILIFLGFYNYLSYYRFFDIEIFPYLTVYEILFSIISELTPLLITALLCLCYIVFMVILPLSPGKIKKKEGSLKERKENDENYVMDPKFQRLRKYKERQEVSTSFIYNNYLELFLKRLALFRKKLYLRQYGSAFSHLFLFFFNGLGLALKILLWSFFMLFTLIGIIIIFSPLNQDLSDYRPFFTSFNWTIFSMFLWCALVYSMISRLHDKGSKNSLRFIQVVPLVFLTFLSITLYQKRKAEETLNYKTYSIQFHYNNRRIKSSKERIFVGKTSDYIFLREVENQKNFIYPVSEIKNLEIIKLGNND